MVCEAPLVGPGLRRRTLVLGLAAGADALRAEAAAGDTDTDTDAVATAWRQRFEAEVPRRLTLPVAEQRRYAERLDEALTALGSGAGCPQAVLLVDRDERVQAACLLLRPPGGGWCWLGATPASTGRVGRFDHFRTPLGAFLHGPHNPDFRALGTVNANGIRGYGARGLRVFDFGWVQAERGWGRGGTGTMRLQVHATDPVRLEPQLGSAASKGCIRITAALNRFLDDHAVLDAAYEAAQAAGRRQWILRPGRTPLPWPGRWLVVVDSRRTERPAWSPLP